jgi:hypothetical protein
MTILDEFRRDAEGVLDRLVDGEMGLHERRELLAGLDDEVGAWRRCALAFLEAQSWRWQLSSAAAEPMLARTAETTKRPVRHGAFWGSALAIAASLVVAFALGRQFSPADPALESLAANRQSAAQEPPNHIDTEPFGAADAPWETVTLTPVGGDGSGEPIQVRVAKDGGDTRSAFGAARSALSTLFSRSFEKKGWDVNRQEHLVPIDLSDGRRLMVPIEEIDLRNPNNIQF